jgi:hypothetical protein
MPLGSLSDPQDAYDYDYDYEVWQFQLDIEKDQIADSQFMPTVDHTGHSNQSH